MKKNRLIAVIGWHFEMLRSHRVHRNCSVFVLLILAAFLGCLDTSMIQVKVTNASSEKLSTIVVSYPEATFGINFLEPGKTFRYKIKPTATGPLSIDFFNSHGVERKSTGPIVYKSHKGTIEIKLTEDGATSVSTLQ
jgi:hypothetical protein